MALIPLNLGVSNTINTLFSTLAIWLQVDNVPTVPILGFTWHPKGTYQGLAYDVNQFPFPNARIAGESINIIPRNYEFDGIPSPQLFSLATQPAVLFGLAQLLKKHQEVNGGLFTIFTVFGMQKSCVLINLDDISSEISDTSQVGSLINLKFFQPIISQNDINTIESLNPMSTSIAAGGRGLPIPAFPV